MAGAIPSDTELYRQLHAAATTRRCLVFAGLPGIGKSLLTRQAATIAQQAGRVVTLLQWDVVRASFEVEPFGSRYPERRGIADPMTRLAVDCWLRHGIARWQAAANAPDLLLIEAPLIGGRLISLTQPQQDAAEVLLASDQSLFLLPVPTAEVKEALRQKRHLSKNADPAQADASVVVLDGHVEEINAAGVALGLIGPDTHAYDAEAYASVYLHAMRHRHCLRLPIDRIFEVDGTAEKPVAPTHLEPSTAEVALAFAAAEALDPSRRDRQLNGWYL